MTPPLKSTGLGVLQTRLCFSRAGLTPTLNFIKLYSMLVIRYQRVGRRNDPAYRIVVTEKRSKPKSGGVEILGSYHPKTKQTAIKNDRVLYWLSKGAKLSSTVHNLMISNKVISGNKISPVRVKKTEKGEVKELAEVSS